MLTLSTTEKEVSGRVTSQSTCCASDLAPQLFSRIFRIQLSQLPQQFLGLLVPRHRHGNLHLDNLISARAVLRGRRHAFLAQPQLLPRLRPRRNLQYAAPINRRHFDLRSQSRLHRRNRHDDVNIVALPPKQRMLINPDNHIKVAARPAAYPRIALASNPYALSIARPRLNSNLQRVGPLDRAFTMAHRTSRNIFPCPMAARARDIKLHPPARLLDRPFAMALRTFPWRLHISIPVAVPAHFAARDIQLHHTPANRRPERHINLILEIAAFLRPCVSRVAAPAAGENIRENIAKATA